MGWRVEPVLLDLLADFIAQTDLLAAGIVTLLRLLLRNLHLMLFTFKFASRQLDQSIEHAGEVV